jgi:mono/diheme cytochrome c family protein
MRGFGIPEPVRRWIGMARRGPVSSGLGLGLIALLALGSPGFLAGCGDREWVPVPGSIDGMKSSAEFRAGRRLFDGAPPVIGHDDFGADCAACHDAQGIGVAGVGFAPASPHAGTGEASRTIRCRQCHVFATTTDLFVQSDFVGFRQDMRAGGRLYPGAPPTIPHQLSMRENCAACHTGPGARAEILTSHPERTRCTQCHVPVTTRETFSSAVGEEPGGSEES